MPFLQLSEIAVAFLGVVLVIAIHRVVSRWLRYRSYKLPPGPTGLPVIGHMTPVNHLSLFDHRDRYGDVSYVNVRGSDMIVLNSIEVIRAVFIEKDLFHHQQKSFIQQTSQRLVTCDVDTDNVDTDNVDTDNVDTDNVDTDNVDTDNVDTDNVDTDNVDTDNVDTDNVDTDNVDTDNVDTDNVDTDNHENLQKLLYSVLIKYTNGEELEKTDIIQNINDEIQIVIDELKRQVGDEININTYLQPSLINIFWILAIGERLNYNEIKMKDIETWLMLGREKQNKFMDTVLKTFPLLHSSPFGPAKIYHQKNDAKLRCMQLLFESQKNILEPGKDMTMKTGMIYELLKLKTEVPLLTDDDIKDIISDVFGSGFSVIDALLQSFFLVILHHPKVQDRIQNEIDDVIGDERRPMLSDRHKMPYTMSSILELIRYSSVLPVGVPQACTSDINLCGYTIPSGCTVIPNLFCVLHDDKLWTDPWKYDPTRFLDTAGNLLPETHRHQQYLHGVATFGVWTNSRGCIGETFVKARLFMYITSLLQVFRFRPGDNAPSGDPRHYRLSGVVICPSPYKLQVDKRLA